MELPMKSLIKLDENGNLLYITNFEGYSQGMGKGKSAEKGKNKGGMMGISMNDKKVDNSGNLYIAGSFMADSLKFGKFSIYSHSMYMSSFIAKIDPAGNFLWVTIDSTSAPSGYSGSEAASLVQDASGDILVFGDFNTTEREIGNLSINAVFGSRNLYFLRLDGVNGSAKTYNSFGGEFQDIAQSIAEDGKGYYYITGFTSSATIFGQSTPGNQNFSTFLGNIDANGTLNWAKLINTEIQGTPYSLLKLIIGPDKFPVLTGVFQAATVSLDGIDIYNHDPGAYYRDFFTVRLDPSTYTPTYFKSFGSAGYDDQFNIYGDIHNTLTVIAPINDTVFYIGNDTLKYPLYSTVFIIAYMDSDGTLLARASFLPYTDQNFTVMPSNIAQSYSGYLGIAGSFNGPNLFLGSNNLLTQDTVSYDNMFIAKMAYTITGNVYDKNSSKITDGYVKLFVLSKNGPANLVDSVWVNREGNSYYFNDAPLTGGLLYAAADTTIYPNYVGTYAGNSMLWTGATILDLISTPPATFDVTLQQILPVSGPGSIAGTVTETISDTTQLMRKSTGRPMKGASVVLVGKSTKGIDSIIAITYTDDAGYYQFVKIPVGSYDVWIDVAGLGMKEYYSIGITELSPEVANVNYIVAETGIYKDPSSSVKTTRQLKDAFSVYPNPAFDFIKLTVSMTGISSASLDIYSVNGSFVGNYILECLSNGSAYINVSQLKAGMYIIKAQFPGKTPLYTRFIKG